MRYKVVIVHWDDACEHAEGDDAPRHAPKRQILVGFLLRSDKRGISVAGELNADGTGWRTENFVPRALIRKVERIAR